MERFYSDPPAASKLAKPSVRPSLPPHPHRHIYGQAG
jgi:hypothetical protein